MVNHIHFIVWAAQGRVEHNYSDVTYVDVIADDITEAVAKATKLCPGRSYYWVNNIVEHHEHSVGG